MKFKLTANHINTAGFRSREVGQMKKMLAMGVVFSLALMTGNASSTVLIRLSGGGPWFGGGTCADWADFTNSVSTASCKDLAAWRPNSNDVIQRTATNSVFLTVGGKKISLVSDAAQEKFDMIQKKFSLSKKEDFEPMFKAITVIKNDNGPISDNRIKQLSNELKVPVDVNTSPMIPASTGKDRLMGPSSAK